MLLLGFLFALVISLVNFLLVEFKLIKDYQGPDLLKKYGVYGTFFVGCILAPVLEESVFRWHLRKRYVSVYFVLLSVAGLIIWFTPITWLCFLIFFAGLTMAIVMEYYLKKKSQTSQYLLRKKMFPFVFYFSAIIFGLVHLGNFEGLTFKDPAFIIFISSQTFGGLTMGYICIKYGLRYSMLLHACYNFIFLILSILFPNF